MLPRRLADQAAGGEVLQQAADDFARAAQFGGDLLVGDAERNFVAQRNFVAERISATFEQQGGQAGVHAAKSDFVDDFHHARQALGEQIEDEGAPGVEAPHPLAEIAGGDQDGFGRLLDDGDGRKGLAAEDGVRASGCTIRPSRSGKA